MFSSFQIGVEGHPSLFMSGEVDFYIGISMNDKN